MARAKKLIWDKILDNVVKIDYELGEVSRANSARLREIDRKAAESLSRTFRLNKNDAEMVIRERRRKQR